MANNIFVGANSCAARVDLLFADAQITFDNTEIIYLINGLQLLSYKPTRSINPINAFQIGKGYYIISKIDQDLSAYVVPPIPNNATVEDMTDSVWYDITGNEGASIVFDGTNGKIDLTGKKIIQLTYNNEELKPAVTPTTTNQYSFDPATATFGFFNNLEAPGHLLIIYR